MTHRYDCTLTRRAIPLEGQTTYNRASRRHHSYPATLLASRDPSRRSSLYPSRMCATAPRSSPTSSTMSASLSRFPKVVQPCRRGPSAITRISVMDPSGKLQNRASRRRACAPHRRSITPGIKVSCLSTGSRLSPRLSLHTVMRGAVSQAMTRRTRQGRARLSMGSWATMGGPSKATTRYIQHKATILKRLEATVSAQRAEQVKPKPHPAERP